MEFNKYQTPLTDELLNSLKDEVKEQLLEFINTVPYIQNLISPNRKYAKDLKRDEQGRIIVDLTDPHILENMDYFRPTALHFKKYGCFTKLKPNSNPNSEYGKWFREERNRCWNGMIRPSDGEWVTGFMYWYMNYCQIMLSQIRKGTKKADRVEDFPEMWEGIYLRFHYLDQARNGGKFNEFNGGNHACELARRGCSKSFGLASIMSHNFVLGENKEAYKRTTTVLAAYLKEYLGGKDGTITKFTPMIDFVAQNTQFPRSRLTNAPKEMLWQMGYKDLETGTDKGSLNTVMGVGVKDDEAKLRGKRGYILIEEMGSFPNLLSLYNTLRPGVEEGDIVFGLIYMVGTAGDNDSDFAGASEIMYNPKGYNMYCIPNVYDKLSSGKPNFVYFFPAYLNRKGCYNENGVSDVIQALIEILNNRYKVKYNSTEQNTIIRTIAEIPITPAEAIVKVGVNILPAVDATQRLAELDNNTKETDEIYVGQLSYNSINEIEFKPTVDIPIRKFPHRDNKLLGAIEIEKFPEKDKTGRVFSGRYIAGIDPYDDDGSTTLSLGSIRILDLWTDRYVAWYTGRQMFADDFFEICRKLLMFYNAQANYENNKKGLFGYFAKMNSLYLLTDTLSYLRDKDMIKGELIGNKTKGTNATQPINNQGLLLFRYWLLAPVTTIEYIDGEEVEITKKRIYQIKDRALLEEIASYNPEGNFDRISDNIMLMLLREDKLILYNNDVKKSKEKYNSNYLGNDKFFTSNYDDKMKFNRHK